MNAITMSMPVMRTAPKLDRVAGALLLGFVAALQLSIAADPNNSHHLVKPEDAIRAAIGRQ